MSNGDERRVYMFENELVRQLSARAYAYMTCARKLTAGYEGHGQPADDLQRADDSSVPLARHLEVQRARQREHLRVLHVLLPLQQSKQDFC